MHARLFAGTHGATPFRADCAVDVFAHLALEAVFPALFGGDAHVPESVFVNGKEAAFKARVVGNVRDVPSHARAIKQDVVTRDVRESLEPFGVEVAKLVLTVHVRFVEDFKIGVRMVAVLFDDGFPHFPPIVHVFRAGGLCRAPIANGDATFGKAGIDDARVSTPELGGGRFVDRNAHAVRAEQFLELPDDTFCNDGCGFVCIREACARKQEHVRDEIVALIGPVHTAELACDGKRICAKKKS